MPLTTQNPPFSYGSTREASFLKSTGRLASVVSVIKDIIKIILKSRTRENCKIAMGEKKKNICAKSELNCHFKALVTLYNNVHSLTLVNYLS